MSNYGTETETTYLDNNLSTIDIITKTHGGIVQQRFKRVSIRVKVTSKQDETTEYLLWTDTVDRCRTAGTLVVMKQNKETWPTFEIDYPKTDIDGSYFIIRSHTELVP